MDSQVEKAMHLADDYAQAAALCEWEYRPDGDMTTEEIACESARSVLEDHLHSVIHEPLSVPAKHGRDALVNDVKAVVIEMAGDRDYHDLLDAIDALAHLPKPCVIGLADEDIEAIAERLEASDPTSAFWKEFARAVLSSAGASPNAARYELLRRGQHWSVVNGIGDHLRADELDAAIEQEDRAAEKIEIRYERVGRCFWHIGCQAQRHSPPMRLASFKEQDKPATAMFCTACGEGGWYPHGRVGNVCCERIAKATP